MVKLEMCPKLDGLNCNTTEYSTTNQWLKTSTGVSITKGSSVRQNQKI